MKKQIIFAGAGLLLISLLFFLGRTTEPKPAVPTMPAPNAQAFDIQNFISQSKQKLSPSQLVYLSGLENRISRGDIVNQQVIANTAIAQFWKDSAQLFEPYAFYISEAAKLDNSEKSLTFAAQILLNNIRGEHDDAKANWETSLAIELFEKAIVLDPQNDDLRIGLGSCYVFGKSRNGDPQETMKGIQELLGVVRRDSTNMKAQLVLGVGGYVSGQYDKAIARLLKVIEKEPTNIEATAFLADTYAASGNKTEAIKWYNTSKRLVNNPSYSKEVDERIRLLQQ